MNDTVRVDLHLHSSRSDGELAPEALARKVADSGVVFAALTDHNTFDGTEEFREAFARCGGVAIPGLELTVECEGTTAHLLVYGVSPSEPALRALCQKPAPLAVALDAVHAADGIAFLAHPLHTWQDINALRPVLQRAAETGLDGIEARYGQYSKSDQDALTALAESFGLLVCAGSDYHGPKQGNDCRPGVDLEIARWKQFRSVLPAFRQTHEPAPPRFVHAHAPVGLRDRYWFLLHIVVPAFLCMMLFVGAIFAVILPAFEDQLLQRKREMIRELVNSAWGILDAGERDVRAGRTTLEQAQRDAIERFRRLRYGQEEKDYFWITDMHPRMVMHPYRTDLEGRDLTDMTDPQGVRLFVRFVDEVRASGHGYVAYVWQWKDQPEHLAPKESYVRGFAPWGWVIGTGIYLDDVNREIGVIKRRMLEIAMAIAVVMCALLALLILEGRRLERRRRQAEEDLRESHERYRALVEGDRDGTLVLVGGRCVYANGALLEMLGYSEHELPFVDWDDLAADAGEALPGLPDAQAETPHHAVEGDPFEAQLRRKDGSLVEVLLTASPISMGGRAGVLLLVRDLTEHAAWRRRERAEREELRDRLEATWLLLNQPISAGMRPVPVCSLDTRIEDAVELMMDASSDALVVTTESGATAGIVTDHDFRVRVVRTRHPVANSICEIMTAPVETISEDALVCEALQLMGEQQRNHLVVVDFQGKPAGIVGGAHLTHTLNYPPTALNASVARALNVAEVKRARGRLPFVVHSLLEAGTRPRTVARTVTGVSGQIVGRLLELAARDMGPAPLPYAWMAFGSEGREEQTLVTDQDNALVYADPDPDAAGAAEEYFRRLAERVCAQLDDIGYARCKGGMMADNPRWNGPLSHWKTEFTRWIAEPDPHELLQCNICFDLRCIHGESGLVGELLQHVLVQVRGRSSFFYNLAHSIQEARPSLGVLGHIRTDTSSGARNAVNLKAVLLPLVGFARLYALRNGISETHTIDRLYALLDRRVLSPQLVRDLEQAYDLIMALRYRGQVAALAAGDAPTNDVVPETLSAMELETLKLALNTIAFLHRKLETDRNAGM
ncbi:MAG: cache domain-containing protein [Candidatus Hydrogenedentes bacterium]|nr:cache domain-containing protein [Candidatus Hydrogenedentota bacterium]